jgi:F-type H+-transporting ATPase subunit O
MLLAAATRSVSATPGLGRRAASAVASKYSKAVFGAALQKSPQTLTKVATELTNASNAIKSSPEISTFVRNPTLSSQERLAGLQVLYGKLEGAKKDGGVSEITKNFFEVLSENGRLSEAEEVILGFQQLLAQHKGELTVTVTSAQPLPKDMVSRLESALKQSQTAQAAKVVKIENKVRWVGFLVCVVMIECVWWFRSILVFLAVLLSTLVKRRLI